MNGVIDAGAEWGFPFVWTLIGEYVFEIVQQIHANIDSLDAPRYLELLARNPELVRVTRARAQSYWSAYFRHNAFPRFAEYPAAAIFARFGLTD